MEKKLSIVGILMLLIIVVTSNNTKSEQYTVTYKSKMASNSYYIPDGFNDTSWQCLLSSYNKENGTKYELSYFPRIGGGGILPDELNQRVDTVLNGVTTYTCKNTNKSIIIDGVAKLSKLKKVEITGNKIGGGKISIVGSVWQNLEEIDLSYNKIKSITLINDRTSNNKLKTLNLSGNLLTTIYVKGFEELTTLDLSQNKLSTMFVQNNPKLVTLIAKYVTKDNNVDELLGNVKNNAANLTKNLPFNTRSSVDKWNSCKNGVGLKDSEIASRCGTYFVQFYKDSNVKTLLKNLTISYGNYNYRTASGIKSVFPSTEEGKTWYYASTGNVYKIFSPFVPITPRDVANADVVKVFPKKIGYSSEYKMSLCGEKLGDNYGFVCDVNGDGIINVGDAVALLKQIVFGFPIETGEGYIKRYYKRDASGDGRINTGDAVLILRYVFDQRVSVLK